MNETRLIGRWHQYIPAYQTSALDFYASVESGIQTLGLPDEIRTSRVVFKEAGIVSANREYLRVERRRVAFDLCAAPYGSGYFFSWWCHRLPAPHTFLALVALLLGFLFVGSIAAAVMKNSCSAIFVVPVLLLALAFLLGYAVNQEAFGDEEYVMEIPIVGWLYERLFNPQTYFRHDTALMFQDAVRHVVKKAIDGTLSAQGLRALSDDAWKPTPTLGR